MPPRDREHRLLRISEVARASGVPAATVKHYLREGLLPEAAHKTSRNMAYYDPSTVERVKTIKRLQQERFLPLALIKQVLSEGASADDLTTRAAISRVLARARPDEVRTRAELLDSGVKPVELDWLRQIGLLTPELVDGEERYGGDDLALLRLLGASRRAGLAPEMLPASILAEYVAAIRALVRTELLLFQSGVSPRAGQQLGSLTEVAATLSEELVVLLRRKLLLPVLSELESSREPARSDRRSPKRGATRRRSAKF